MSVAKALVALLIAGLTAVASALTDDTITVVEAVQVAIAVVTAVGVWVAANVPTLPYAKMVIAALLASLSLAVTYVTDGLTGAEVVNLVLAALAVFGVYVVPNSVRRYGYQAVDPGRGE